MKYYHLIGISLGIFVSQFIVESVFQVSVSRGIGLTIAIIQGIILGLYTVLSGALVWVQLRAAKTSNQPSTDQHVHMSRQSDQVPVSQYGETTSQEQWLKAS